MSIEGLGNFLKDQLIEELINRQTFVGIVIYHREDAKDGRLESGEVVMTKSPPLSREGVEHLLQTGNSLIPMMFPADQHSELQDLLRAEDSVLRLDETGTIQVGKGRITLDLVIEEYESGATPEGIASGYDSLRLPDVYSAIGCYLRHQPEIRHDLQLRNEHAEELRKKIEAERPRISREELLRRRRSQEQLNAPTGQ